MQGVLKYIFIIATFFLIANANNLNYTAFNEYKNGNYKAALKLYLKSAKQNNTKALLMIALFYEKGLGIKEDKNKAIKIYKNILKRTSSIQQAIKNRDEKKINITVVVLERLYSLNKDKKYLILSKKLRTILSKIKNNQDILFDSSNASDDYLILCPGAEVVAPEDREGIENFDCALFEKFPKKMAKFMHLRHLRFKANELPRDIKYRYIVKINRKIKPLIEPMLEYLQKEVVSCYSNAVDMNDIRSCDYDYLLKTDPMTFTNNAYMLEQHVLNNNLENHELSPFEKEEFIDKLLDDIIKKRYGKNWKSMVK